MDHQELIFEPFRQAPGQSSHYGGTGLGLSISRKLIELMNGTLTLVSTPGKGSSFIITVKNVEQVCAVTPLAHTGQIESLHFKAALVLIADDVQSNCDVITALLAETGLQTIVATHGKKAVEISKNEKPDLILMDIRMPIMDGIEAARKIKEDPQTAMIPIIALTASGSTTDVNLAGNPDFSGRLLKPVTRSSIQKEISRHLQVTEEQQFSEEVVDLVISEPEELVTIFNQSIMPKAASLSGAVKTAQLRDFAKEVNELAISYANYELQKIAEHLASAVNSFDITKIREILAIISKK